MSSSSTTTAEWVLELLAGFRFHPKEEQMVNLLKKKMEGKDSQASHIMPESYQTWEPGNQSISLFLLFLRKMMQGQFIPEIDLLKSEPWDLPGLLFPDSPYQPREWFAFSRPDHVNINSPRCNRATKKGYWKSTGQPREIKSQEHSFTCKKRTLTFHIGRVSNSKKTNWVMHEYFPTETKLGSSGFVLVCLKNKSASHKSGSKKLKDTLICSEFADPNTYIGSNSENQPPADAINHKIPSREELIAHKGPQDDQFGSGDHDLHDEDSPFSPPEPPRPPGLGNVPDVSNDECSNWQSPIGENGSYLTNKNNISTNNGKEPLSNAPSEAPYENITEAEDNLRSLFDPLQREDYTLESAIFNSEQGDVSHTNSYIGCSGSQFPYLEISTLFPQRS